MSNDAVLESIIGKKAKSIMTCVSTLYPKYPHYNLLTVLNSLVDLCFNRRSSHDAHWIQDRSQCKACFDMSQIKSTVKSLIDNVVINVMYCNTMFSFWEAKTYKQYIINVDS